MPIIGIAPRRFHWQTAHDVCAEFGVTLRFHEAMLMHQCDQIALRIRNQHVDWADLADRNVWSIVLRSSRLQVPLVLVH